ncbi:hypothetical protein SOVF_000130 [Spinacia oleracea]|uniref:Cx9C motif-containing protein 4 n=1 Tax=Spinacia oleracea TaxID=3562 RepID=A0A9R0JBJ0_SPIOL|nr:uncharacterized protein LOC110802834 [Spinacia oleracea]KNA26093.1 hypothetical protein SOVF_000130 [Spinacia oleracea]
MTQPSKEPCKKQACDIQACLSKNNFNPQRCIDVILKLQKCCENCNYDSTHCASMSGLLKQHSKPSN